MLELFKESALSISCLLFSSTESPRNITLEIDDQTPPRHESGIGVEGGTGDIVFSSAQ
jgi:hypothetical protein